MNLKEITELLRKPFNYNDIEWRISRVFKSGKATVLAYMTSRGVMDRLDEVFGVDGWQDMYEFIENNVVCNLKVKIGDVWISKSDGAPQTNFESFKGGISDALKRTAVKLGIGRYLYNLSESWVTIQSDRPQGVDKKHIHYIKDKKVEIAGYWISPELPDWALPEKKQNRNETNKKEIIEQSDAEKEELIEQPNNKNPLFETFKIEMRKLYKELGKDKFFTKLGSLGYETVDDLENVGSVKLDNVLKEMKKNNVKDKSEPYSVEELKNRIKKLIGIKYDIDHQGTAVKQWLNSMSIQGCKDRKKLEEFLVHLETMKDIKKEEDIPF